MAHTVFISDLHLTPTRQDLVQGFINLCNMEMTQTADALYILGDFVEFWIGDDTPTTGLDKAFTQLKELAHTGVQVYFQHGNRDFLIGEQFSKTYSVSLLSDHEVIDLYGTPTLLLHGDTLCTDDVDYQEFRNMVRDSNWQSDILKKTLYGRIQYAQALRAKTTKAVSEKPSEIMDVNQQAVLNAFHQYNVRHIIHGHTHRPAEHLIEKDQNTLSRVVLSDWHKQGQYYCVYDNGTSLFKYFDIPNSSALSLKSKITKLKLGAVLLKLFLLK